MNTETDFSLHQHVLDTYGLASIVVDANLAVVRPSPRVRRYLPGLQPSQPLLADLPEALHAPLHAALNRTLKKGLVSHLPPLTIPAGDETQTICLTVHPVQEASPKARGLVLFHVLDHAVEASSAEGTLQVDANVAGDVLTAVHAASWRLSDGATSSTWSSREEIQMMNEELRIANEELHEKHQELRAQYAALESVERTLREKNRELSQTTSDLTNLIAATDVGTLFLDRDLRVRRFTPHLSDLFNLLPTDLGRKITELSAQLPYTTLERDVRLVIENLVPLEREVGTQAGRWYLIRLRPYLSSDDRIDGTVLTFVDITARRHTEKALFRSEARSRALLEGIPDPIYRLSPEGVYLDVQSADEALLPMPAPQLAGRALEDVLPEGIARRVREGLTELYRTGALRHIDFTMVTMDGNEHEFEGRMAQIESDGVLLITRDVTHQRRLEREIVRVSTSEQQRIGHDLHDILGSQLFGISMAASKLARRARAGREVETEPLEELSAMAREAITQTRALAHSLCPFDHDAQDLASALQALATEVTKLSDLRCTFAADASLPAISNEASAQLYRIAQEALTNALRHASGAATVNIRLNQDDGRLTLTVTDDGCGLPDAPADNGVGLQVMDYRARMIGASLKIKQASPSGTKVSCALPLA